MLRAPGKVQPNEQQILVTPTPAHERMWELLERQGYAVILGSQGEGAELGLDPAFATYVSWAYHNRPGLLRREHYAFVTPQDRDRARDVVRYSRQSDGSTRLREHDTTAIGARSSDSENRPPSVPREYNRALVLRDPAFVHWIGSILTVIPPGRRENNSTFGLNFFTTHSTVSGEKPHQDDERWVGILLCDKFCEGGETSLYNKDAFGEPQAEPCFGVTLEPGDLLAFDDTRFFHRGSDLAQPAGTANDPEQLFRQTLIVTDDHAGTYLTAA